MLQKVESDGKGSLQKGSTNNKLFTVREFKRGRRFHNQSFYSSYESQKIKIFVFSMEELFNKLTIRPNNFAIIIYIIEKIINWFFICYYVINFTKMR